MIAKMGFRGNLEDHINRIKNDKEINGKQKDCCILIMKAMDLYQKENDDFMGDLDVKTLHQYMKKVISLEGNKT